jgi:hypothetical protein
MRKNDSAPGRRCERGEFALAAQIAGFVQPRDLDDPEIAALPLDDGNAGSRVMRGKSGSALRASMRGSGQLKDRAKAGGGCVTLAPPGNAPSGRVRGG